MFSERFLSNLQWYMDLITKTYKIIPVLEKTQIFIFFVKLLIFCEFLAITFGPNDGPSEVSPPQRGMRRILG